MIYYFLSKMFSTKSLSCQKLHSCYPQQTGSGIPNMLSNPATRMHAQKSQISMNVPSGKHTKNYGQSPCLMGKLTINGHFQ